MGTKLLLGNLLFQKHTYSIVDNERSSYCAFLGPKDGKYTELENVRTELCPWIMHQQQHCEPCNVGAPCKGSCTCQEDSAEWLQNEQGWFCCFVRRKNLSLRRRTTLCQKLPKDYTKWFPSIGIWFECIKGISTWCHKPAMLTKCQCSTWVCQWLALLELRKYCIIMVAIIDDGKKLPQFVISKEKPCIKFKVRGMFRK